MTSSRARNRRADAQHSRAAILDAAVHLLNDNPNASVEAIAAAAEVTRQTVYAHFSSRERLEAAVLDRLTEETIADIDAAHIDTGSAADALLRLIDAAARTAGRYPVLLRRLNTLPTSREEDQERHTAVTDRLERIIRRGQRTGEFDDQLPPDWLVAVVIKLSHVASEERDAGRLTDEESGTVLRTSLLRLLGTT